MWLAIEHFPLMMNSWWYNIKINSNSVLILLLAIVKWLSLIKVSVQLSSSEMPWCNWNTLDPLFHQFVLLLSKKVSFFFLGNISVCTAICCIDFWLAFLPPLCILLFLMNNFVLLWIVSVWGPLWWPCSLCVSLLTLLEWLLYLGHSNAPPPFILCDCTRIMKGYCV